MLVTPEHSPLIRNLIIAFSSVFDFSFIESDFFSLNYL